jgi:hypothetical protein
MRALFAGILFVGVASACNGEASRCDGEPSPCSGAGLTATKLSECGFYSEADIGRLPLLVIPDACYDRCLADASCEELSATLCRESIEVLVRCDERCAYHCPMGELIRHDQECDGVENCEGGADEAGCPEPDEACGSATRCDGVPECVDLSDERACEPFVCNSGQEVVGGTLCDGIRDCWDASDESRCARLILSCL